MTRLRAVLRWGKGAGLATKLAVTVALVLAAFLLRLALEPWLNGLPFALFFLPILLVSLVFEQGTGFLATALSAGLALAFFVEPRGSPEGLVNVLAFVVVAFLVTFIAERFHALAGRLDDLEREKNTLLHEFNHRARNNLQILASTLAIQGLRDADPRVREVLAGVSERIAHVGELQRHLFAPDAGDTVDAAPFLKTLCHDFNVSLAGLHPVGTTCDAEDMRLPRDLATAIGIIVNELVTNALKYAFPDGQGGSVAVHLGREGAGDLVLTVSDQGIGCSAEKAHGTGSTLVSALASQYGGSVSWKDAAPGCCVTVRIPAARARTG